MRLRAMNELINQSLDNLSYGATGRGDSTYIIEESQQAIRAIQNLKGFEFLAEDIQQLMGLETIYFNRAVPDRIIVDSNTFQTFKRIIDTATIKIQAVKEAIEQSVPEQDAHSISIKLPDFHAISDVGSFFDKLGKVLDQAIVNEYIKGSVKLQNFDSGSLWVEVIVGGTVALAFIGRMTKAAAAIRNEVYEWKFMKKKLEGISVKQAALEEVDKALKDSVETKARLEAKMVMQEFNINETDQEYHTKLTYAIRAMGELIFQGTEFHHALRAPDEAKQQFPETKQPSQLESTIKHLDSTDAASN
jgi:hypothetical protein